MGFAIPKIVLEIIFDSYVGFNSYSCPFVNHSVYMEVGIAYLLTVCEVMVRVDPHPLFLFSPPGRLNFGQGGGWRGGVGL